MMTWNQSLRGSLLLEGVQIWLAGLILLATLSPAALAQHQLWLGQFGSSAGDFGYALAPDGAGGFLVAGDTGGDLAGPNAGNVDAFLARHNAAGDQVWIEQFGTSAFEKTRALAADGAGGVYVAGETTGDLGAVNLGINDDFLARYDSDGNQLWLKQFGTTTYDFANSLAPDGAGGVFVAGFTQGVLGSAAVGGGDVFLARYDSDGNQIWVRQFGSLSNDNVRALATDGAGGVYVGGYTWGSFAAPHAGSADVFYARYDADGNELWVKQFGSPTSDYVESIAPDGAGGFYMSGNTMGDLFGPNAGANDAFIARFDSDGDQLWAHQFGTSEGDYGRAVTGDGAGGALVTGSTGDVLSGVMGSVNAGFNDLYISRFSANGQQTWVRQFGSSAYDSARAITTDGAGNVVIAGFSEGNLAEPNAGSWDVCMARLPIDYCYADCDMSTGPTTLDIFDFLGFQDSFVGSESYACNCDTSTGADVCDVFDFLCFQDAFVAGCPAP